MNNSPEVSQDIYPDYRREVIQLKQEIQKLKNESTKKDEVDDTNSVDKDKNSKKFLQGGVLKKASEKQKQVSAHQPVPKKEAAQQVEKEQIMHKDMSPIQKPVCGDSALRRLSKIPTERLCDVGEAGPVDEKLDKFVWECRSGEYSIECFSFKKIYAKCAKIDGFLPENYDKTTLCSSGDLDNVSENRGNISWTCRGIHTKGQKVGCSALRSVNAKCGLYNDCKIGTLTYSREERDSKFWGCAGINGGMDAHCSARLRVSKSGVCGNEAGTCITGSVKDKTVSKDSITWKCIGLNGGDTTFCSKTNSNPNVESGNCLFPMIFTGTNSQVEGCSQYISPA